MMHLMAHEQCLNSHSEHDIGNMHELYDVPWILRDGASVLDVLVAKYNDPPEYFKGSQGIVMFGLLSILFGGRLGHLSSALVKPFNDIAVDKSIFMLYAFNECRHSCHGRRTIYEIVIWSNSTIFSILYTDDSWSHIRVLKFALNCWIKFKYDICPNVSKKDFFSKMHQNENLLANKPDVKNLISPHTPKSKFDFLYAPKFQRDFCRGQLNRNLDKMDHDSDSESNIMWQYMPATLVIYSWLEGKILLIPLIRPSLFLSSF